MGDRPKRRALRILLLCIGGTLIVLCIIFFTVARAMKPSRAADLPCRAGFGGARCVAVDGFNLRYSEAGNRAGKTVVVLHGGPGMSGHYFGDSFAFLMKDYRVVLYDQRGSGFSQIKPGLEGYTFEALVRELEALRKEVIGRETITLVGHSFGGLVAMRYAADNPGRVERMVLVSPAFARLSRQSAARPFRLLLKYGLPPRDPERANEFFMNMYPALFGSSFYDPGNYGKLKPGYASLAVTMAVADSLGNYDFSSDLRRITAKTLILYGEADLETTAEKFQLELHGLIPGSVIVKFERSGHWAFLEEPALFRASVLAFLRKP